MDLLFYNWDVVTAEPLHRLPGIERFSHFFRAYHFKVVFDDRTGTIRPPVRTKTLFPLPVLRPMPKTFEEICNDRACELLSRADALDVRLLVSWSGGIDSTLALVSLLKNADAAQQRRITVLLTGDSITENPAFYRDHIRNRLAVASSEFLSQYLGGKDIFTSGELNDQLFGSDVIATLIRTYGPDAMHRTYDRTLIHDFFNRTFNDAGVSDFYMDLFERIAAAAPVPITTNYELLWWLNFAVKWQSVYMRALSLLAPEQAALITPEYLHDRYAPFYDSEDFQLWSLYNPDKKIRGTWKSYKWICKDIIYDYTKDAEYRDHKVKRASLANIVRQVRHFSFIDADYRFHKTLEPEQYYDPNNDFK